MTVESEVKPEIVVEVGVSLTCAKAAFDAAGLHVAMEAFRFFSGFKRNRRSPIGKAV